VSIAIEGGMLLVLAGVAAMAVALVVKAVRGGRSTEDARTIQEMIQGLERLEKRIDALETILADRCRGRQE
jgi:phage shock protein B